MPSATEGAVVPYAEADLLPLSGLQHLVFCERQCALIHLEQGLAGESADGRGTGAARTCRQRGD